MVEISDAPMVEISDAPTLAGQDQRQHDRRAQLVHQYLAARKEISDWEIILKRTAEEIADEMPVGTYELGEGQGGIRVQAAPAIFNAARARTVLTPDQYTAICEPRPSPVKAAQLLPGVLLELCKTTTGKPSVRAL